MLKKNDLNDTNNINKPILSFDHLNLPIQSVENEKKAINHFIKLNKSKTNIWNPSLPLLENDLTFNTNNYVESDKSAIITNKYNQKKINNNDFSLINNNDCKKNNSQSTINSISIKNTKKIRFFSIRNFWQILTNFLTASIHNKNLTKNYLNKGILQQISNGRIVAAFRRGKNAAATSFKRRSTSMELANEEKASRVLAFVFSSFFICWTPFFLLNFAKGFCGKSCAVPEWAESLFLWLGYASSTLNPIIYTTFNKRFRKAFSRILRCNCKKSNDRQLNSSYTWVLKQSINLKTQNTSNNEN